MSCDSTVNWSDVATSPASPPRRRPGGLAGRRLAAAAAEGWVPTGVVDDLVVDEVPVHILDHHGQFVDLLVVERTVVLLAPRGHPHGPASGFLRPLLDHGADVVGAGLDAARIRRPLGVDALLIQRGVDAAQSGADAAGAVLGRFGVPEPGGSVAGQTERNVVFGRALDGEAACLLSALRPRCGCSRRPGRARATVESATNPTITIVASL